MLKITDIHSLIYYYKAIYTNIDYLAIHCSLQALCNEIYLKLHT